MAGLESGDVFGSIGFSGSSLMSGMDALTTMFIYMFITAFVGAILFGCIYLLSFKIPVRVYEKTNAGYTYIDTKARQFKTKDGVTKWRLLKWIKETHPAPDNDLIFLSSKGKPSAEAIRERGGFIQFVKRDLTGERPTVITGEEIQMTVNEMRRAEEYKKKKFSDILKDIFPYIVLAMILIIFMVFFNDVVQPSMDFGVQLKSVAESQNEAMVKMSEACLRVYGEQPNFNSSVVKSGDPFIPN